MILVFLAINVIHINGLEFSLSGRVGKDVMKGMPTQSRLLYWPILFKLGYRDRNKESMTLVTMEVKQDLYHY